MSSTDAMSDHPIGNLCGATKKNGEPCGAPAGMGTDHVGFLTCKHHLGRSVNHVKAAEKEAVLWRQTLADEMNPSVRKLADLRDNAVSEGVQRGAAKDILDTGVKVSGEDGGETTINIIMDLRELT